MQDGFYLFNTWVSEVEVNLTKQANDLTTPASLQTSYANLFTLPDTTLLRTILQNAEQVDAGGRDPYRLIPTMVIEDGEVIFSGSAALQSFQGGWKVLLSGPARSLFDQLADLKLSDLDLSQYDHKWSLESAASYVGAESGILYALIDNGSLDGGVFAQDTITPSIYVSTLITTMLKQCGYRVKGDWLSDPLIKRMFLPFVNELPKNHDQEWVDDRYARVTTPDNPNPLILRQGSPINLILPFSIDSHPTGVYLDGRLDAFKAERATYKVQDSGRISVQATVNFNYFVVYGAPEVKLQVLRNGQVAAEEYWSVGGDGGFSNGAVVLSLNDKVVCLKGDELQIRLQGNARTQIASYRVTFDRKLGAMFAAFAPDPTVQPGDVWPIAGNLPDMTCADLLRSIALMSCATFNIDANARTIEIQTLNGVLSNEVNATDLSSCVVENDEPENLIILPGYAQKNLLKWKALDDKTLAGFGDGVIGCDAQNIPLEATLFELPFSPTVDSKNNVPGYGFPVYIETRTVTGSGANLEVQANSTTPRLLLAEPSKPVTVTVNAVITDLTTVPTQIQLTPCWWASRQPAIQTPNNVFSLAFDRPTGITTREQTLIQRYFGSMKRVLRRPRQLTVSAYLTPSQLATVDLYAPVRLRGVRAGSLELNDGFYYLNKISNYRAGLPCQLILIAY